MLLADAIRRYHNHMQASGRAESTRKNAKSTLKELAEVLAAAQITDLGRFDHDALMHFREEIAWRLTSKGTPLSSRSQLEALGHVAAFSRYLVAEGWLLADPSKNLPRPKKARRLPRGNLDSKDMDALLSLPNTRTARGFRDRLILETLYSAALRREEIANLELNDIDTDGGYVYVREGKGCKDRVVPLGKSVCNLLKSYLLDIRPHWPFLAETKSKHLFLSRWGKGMTPNSVWAVVHKYVLLAGFEKPVSTHTLRHACATAMLRNGAPIRQLQEMLGHNSLETTQIYTRVTINDLQDMHRKFHPRERKDEREF